MPHDEEKQAYPLKHKFSYLIYYNNQMKELSPMLFILIFAVLSATHQWFTEDSNLISASQFNSKIAQDKISYKIVKYFTPHCPYCRHLKTVIDHLKHKKQWCFKIYDFNCQQYPQFCSRNLKSTSFPYTAVFDQNGKLIEQIHGFYPEPIITSTFDSIQQKCLTNRASVASKINPSQRMFPLQIKGYQQISIGKNQQKQGELSQPQHQPKVQLQSKLLSIEKIQQHSASQSLHLDQIEASSLNKKLQNLENKDNQPKSTQVQQQNKKDQAVYQLKTQSKLQNQGKSKQKPEGTVSKIYHTYLFYGVCLFCVSYYIYSLETTPVHLNSNPEQRQHHNQKKLVQHPKESDEKQKDEQKEDNLPSVQQNEQVEHVSDQEL